MGKQIRKSAIYLAPVLIIGAAIISLVMMGNRSHEVDFNRDIRPIFNTKCISCHGGVKKNGGFSLITRADALALNKSGEPAIVPGKPESSELLRRLTHHDPEVRMPMDAEPLSEKEVNLLSRWIKEGAEWKDHWAFIKPDLNLQPPSVRSSWIRNDIDRFVFKRLRSENLSPSDEAEKPNLIRRVSLDLIGLPPTPEAVEAFVADESEAAFENAVDRLLESPQFGERWAAMWLDLARYSDSQGYQKDRGRNVWRYRDWVIDAFNRDMPFDQFTIEQLAGDLMEESGENQLLATTFHRNTMSNDEGGTDDEEFRVAAVIDRVNTTFEIWQGITVGCVQCHSHPYDPVYHEEFYELFAFFNNTEDADKTNEHPTLRLLSPAQKQEIDDLKTWLSQHADTTAQEWQETKQHLSEIRPGKTPVMQELPADSSRITHVFERGNWLVNGEEVTPSVPGILNPMPTGSKPNRLGLAQWLVDAENPLTTRVIVNRFWEQLFGNGIVLTLEDLGSQGEPPSHPELLDWLAVQFRTTHNWSTKQLLKQIVMSATYRQSSAVTPKLQKRDADNRLLARGPRIRLSAEQIRDQALAVSGLLSTKMFGPSVMPPQPEGVWQVIRNVMKWRSSKGEDRYRRGLYTYWRRSSPYPSMVAFDSPSRELCVSRRIRTNTPIQALVTLNDSTYLEAAEALARKVQQEGGTDVGAQLVRAYKLALMQAPDSDQLKALKDFYVNTREYYQQQPDSLAVFLPHVKQATPELAALTHASNVILNLDQFIMKE